MAYFQDEHTRNRIYILYFMDKMDAALTYGQITNAFTFDNEWLGYFDVLIALQEMESRGFIAAVPCAFGQGYTITGHGKETLTLFDEQLPQSLKEACDDYVVNNRERLLRSEQFSAKMICPASGGCNAVLQALDNDRIIVNMMINLPDEQSAKRVCDNWQENAADAYATLIKILMK